MSGSAVGLMNWSVALRLGRVSNLPTVWTNVCAGVVLSGAAVTAQLTAPPHRFAFPVLCRRHVPQRCVRPALRSARATPSSDTRRRSDLGDGVCLRLWSPRARPRDSSSSSVTRYPQASAGGRQPRARCWPPSSCFMTRWHKANPIGPLIMGLCRLLVYVIAGLAAAGALARTPAARRIVSLCYLIGLTYVAKQESLRRVDNVWPLLFLAVPFVYGLPLAVASVAALILYLLLLAAVIGALIFSVPAGGARRSACR